MKPVLILANGPGELWDWARPVIRELNRRNRPVSLLLLPCQFASGEERRVAEGLGVDDLRGPFSLAGTLKNALSMGRSACGVLQLGGDLLWGRAAAGAGRRPLLCYAYGKKKGMARCDRVFTAFPSMAEAMGRGVEPAGDLARDCVDGCRRPDERPEKSVLIFPGSRAALREFALPFLKEAAPLLKKGAPQWEFKIALSPFSPPGEADKWRDAGFTPAAWSEASKNPSLAVTQPGTNTLELMHRGVPFCVLVPFSAARQIPLSGLAGMVASIPLAGPALKEAWLRRRGAGGRLLAWPNRIAGRMIAPELVGDITPVEAAEAVLKLINDEPRRKAMGEALAQISSLAPEGAAARIADEIERMAPGND